MILREFQEILKKKNIDAYIIPTSDYHNSEYISDFFKVRAYLSNFTGSAGTLLVTQKEAFLWTDGRYHIQASQEINPSITLMKQGLPGVPTIKEFLKSKLQPKQILAFDGKVISTSLGKSLKEALPEITFTPVMK